MIYSLSHQPPFSLPGESFSMRLRTIRTSTLITLAALVAAMSGSVFGDDKPAAKGLPATAARGVDFVKDIQPLLARCTNCHGIEMQEGGLNLQVKKSALEGGD